MSEDKKHYERQAGDFEIRILADGRIVMIAPDETLLEVAGSLELAIGRNWRIKTYDRTSPHETQYAGKARGFRNGSGGGGSCADGKIHDRA